MLVLLDSADRGTAHAQAPVYEHTNAVGSPDARMHECRAAPPVPRRAPRPAAQHGRCGSAEAGPAKLHAALAVLTPPGTS